MPVFSPPSEGSEWWRYCFHQCVSVCVCVCICAQQTGQSDQFKTVKATEFKFDVLVPMDSLDMTLQKIFPKGAWPGSCDPLNFWTLNANSSKTVKATDFIFDMRVSGDSPDMTD